MNIPEKIRPYLEAALRGETIQAKFNNQWIELETLKGLLDWETLRIKHKPITLAGIEFPEPLRFAPKIGTLCWVVCVSYEKPTYSVTWHSLKAYMNLLNENLIQETEQGAKDQARAMLQAVANAVSGLSWPDALEFSNAPVTVNACRNCQSHIGHVS